MKKGYFGEFGGSFAPEILCEPLLALEAAMDNIADSRAFQQELKDLLQHYTGRPTALTFAKRLTEHLRGPQILLKREDLLHTGAHKINNALGQCLLAKKMQKTHIIAETGAGQHGVAVATVCAHLNLACTIFMGKKDAQRQALNVKKMQLLGAKVSLVTAGSQTLKEAVNAALRSWSANFDKSHYCLGSALGPHPFPTLVQKFQKIIGEECRKQILARYGKLPTAVMACIGGGSNAIGIFQAFLNDPVKLVGVEAGGHGTALGEHAARFQGGKPGVLHGCYTYLLQDEHGQIMPTSSISAGLDYPAIGPQHAYLQQSGRVTYSTVCDDESVSALQLLSRHEGIIPALESAHAIAYLCKTAHEYEKHDLVVVNVSGRGDKDLPQLFDSLEGGYDDV